MLTYKTHKEIPLEFRRVILDETLQKRIAKVSIGVCNEIIDDFLDNGAENETLKEYQVESIKNGVRSVADVVGRQRALVEVDRILEYGESDGLGIYIALRQGGNLIAGYANGDWVSIPSRDALIIRKRKNG